MQSKENRQSSFVCVINKALQNEPAYNKKAMGLSLS